MGRELARLHPVEADLVVPVPDSGNYAALGFAEELNIPYNHAFVRNHYIGRTFLQPTQLIRDFNVRVKLNLIKEAVQGKRVVVLEHADNNQAGGGFAAPMQSSGRSGRDQTNKAKPTLKVQFTVVQEEGQMLIQDIRISNTTAQIRPRNQRNR